LYSGDFAKNLRATLAAVLWLPFEPAKLVDILRSTEASAANDHTNEDHSTFWLVLADQFAKRGIASDDVNDKALHIIDSGLDMAMMKKLGMRASDLNRRRAILQDLRLRIKAPSVVSERRNVFSEPQPLLTEIGDVLRYPTRSGANINPSLRNSWVGLERAYIDDSAAADSWGAMVIVDCGQAFDFLALYRPLTMAVATLELP